MSRWNSRQAITRISVCGFKSLAEETAIAIRPLTLLAGANSSGKSSLMQPLLLLKQTLESSYNFGPLVLRGAHGKFTAFEQTLSHCHADKASHSWRVQLSFSSGRSFATEIAKDSAGKLEVRRTEYQARARESENLRISLEAGAKPAELQAQLAASKAWKRIQRQTEGLRDFLAKHNDHEWSLKGSSEPQLVTTEQWFYRVPALQYERGDETVIDEVFSDFGELDLDDFNPAIQSLIHVPGLRDNPERSYPLTAVGREFPGTFEKYTASVIRDWQNRGDGRLQALGQALEKLGLTWNVEARQLNDVQVELRVNSRPREAQFQEMVSIADVGIGVSQVLPVVVALLVAEPGQLVYLEQPELHLHPRAQAALGDLLADAARRDVRVVVETHSDLLLRRLQTLIAEEQLEAKLVELHWFTRDRDGVTHVSSAELDEAGAYGDWPEDFGQVSLDLDSRYLSAAEKKLWQRQNGKTLEKTRD